MAENPQLAPQSNYLDLTPINLLNESILTLTKKNEILETSCKNRKELLEKSLIEGVNINFETEFNSLVKLLKDNDIIDLSKIKYNDLNWGLPVAIKKLNNSNKSLTVFSIYPYHNLWKNWPFGELWTIENWEYKKYGFFNWAAYFGEKYYPAQWINTIPQNLWECKAEVKPITQEKPTETHTSYKIQKWDSLWKIVKEQYWLGNNTEDNRDIANIIEKLKKDPENKGVIKDDETWKIFVWDPLNLPKIVNFKYKWWKDKEIKLK